MKKIEDESLNITPRDIAFYIRYTRLTNGYTFKEMGNLLDVSDATTHNLENKPSPNMAEEAKDKIIESLGITRQEFLTQLKEMKKHPDILKVLEELRENFKDFLGLQKLLKGRSPTSHKAKISPTQLSNAASDSLPIQKVKTISRILKHWKLSTKDMVYMNEINSAGNMTFEVDDNDKVVSEFKYKPRKKSLRIFRT